MTASMSWELNREHAEFRASVRAFVDRQVRPAFLTLLDGADPGRVRQDVPAEVASQLGGCARLGAVHLTSALPKTRTGKIMRRPLRDLVEHGGPQGDTGAMEDLAGLQAVQQAVAAEAASTA